MFVTNWLFKNNNLKQTVKIDDLFYLRPELNIFASPFIIIL